MINHSENSSGYSLFHVLCEKGHLECIKYLLSIEKHFDTKIDKFKKSPGLKMSPFLLACSFNHIETINYLLTNVYNDNETDESKQYVL